LGLILPQLPRERLIVQTKISPNADPGVFLKNFEESLTRMRLDHVDLLALHGVNNAQVMDWAIRPGGCFEAAQQLRCAGKARYIGFSTHAPLPVILRGIKHGDPETGKGFDYINLHWYYIFQRNWPAIVEATARDMGVFIISPSDKGGKLYEPPQKLVDLCAPLSPMVFNDLFCLSRPEVHTLSIGASRPTDFDEHLKALPLLRKAAELLRPIEARLKEAMRQAVGYDDPEAITQGLPEWDSAPGGLNLPVMLWLLNLARGWDMIEYGKKRFNMLGGADHWFPGAKPSVAARISEAELHRAVANSPYAQQIPQLLKEAVELLSGAEVKRLSQS
jgi:predicted aldo/keto reductase-like oxidoreductase